MDKGKFRIHPILQQQVYLAICKLVFIVLISVSNSSSFHFTNLALSCLNQWFCLASKWHWMACAYRTLWSEIHVPRHVTYTSVLHIMQVIYTSLAQGIIQTVKVVNRKERKYRKLWESQHVAKNNSRCGHMAIKLEKGSLPRCLSEDSDARPALREGRVTQRIQSVSYCLVRCSIPKGI